MLPGAAGLQSGAVLGEQTHWGIMKDLLSFLQHPMGLLTASWWLCPPSAPGSLVARWCGQYLGIRCHRALLSSNILQCCKRGDGTKWSRAGMGTPCGRPPLDGKLRPARSVHLCPARARAARVGGLLRVWGCPERATLLLLPWLLGRAVPAAWGRENKRFPGLPPELGMAPNEKLVPLPLLCPSSAAPLREADDSFGGRRHLVALSRAELRPSKCARPGIAPPGTEGPSPHRLHHAGLLGLPW